MSALSVRGRPVRVQAGLHRPGFPGPPRHPAPGRKLPVDGSTPLEALLRFITQNVQHPVIDSARINTSEDTFEPFHMTNIQQSNC